MRSTLLLLFLFTACSTTPVALQRAPEAEAPFAFNGRVVIRQPARNDSAGLRWTHREGADEISLLGPLGQTVARITRREGRVTLEAEGKRHAAGDDEALMQQVLGWHLPLSGLRYWVTARPQPDAVSGQELDVNGRLSVLRQQGWTIRYSRYTAPGADALPLRMSLQREGVEVRLAIDEWEAQ